MPNDNVLTELQIMEALEAAGVKWQEQRSLANDREILTYGSTPAAHIIAGIRALLAAHPGQPEPNSPIEDLLKRYQDDDFDFTDLPRVKKCSLRYVQTMEDCHVRALLYVLASQPEPRAEVTDTDRLNWLRDETCDLRCIDIPTGAGDSEVRWVV
ncbi:hypothetical protein KDX27_30195, partial [Burkholderia cenocepacia]|nr:hypothetical protein [Burkholderia cenocepacia]MBR8172006.1 hypothetical protein [Burkholderia cenocepacia]